MYLLCSNAHLLLVHRNPTSPFTSIINSMKIFLDTADTQVIQNGYNTGLIDGITTNPTLIMKSGRDPENVYQELIDMGLEDVSMVVVGNRKEMYEEGSRLLISLVSMLQSKFLVHQMVWQLSLIHI